MSAYSQQSQSQSQTQAQAPAPQSAQGPAAQDSQWQAQGEDLTRQWLSLDEVARAKAAEELGLSPMINQGILPHPQQMAQLIGRAQQLAGGTQEVMAGAGVTPEQLDAAKRTLIQAKGRVAGASSRLDNQEKSQDGFWGAAYGAAADWLGGAEKPDQALQQQAQAAIARLEALTGQGEAADQSELDAAKSAAAAAAINWSNAVGQYTGAQDAGGDSAIDALETTRDGAGTALAIGATGGLGAAGLMPAGAAGLATSAGIGGAIGATLQGATELASAEAGTQDGGAVGRVLGAGLIGGAAGAVGDLAGKGAMRLLGSRLLPRVVAASGGRVTEDAAKQVIETAIGEIAGAGFSRAAEWAVQQAQQPSAEGLAEHVQAQYGDAIVNKAVELAEQGENHLAA